MVSKIKWILRGCVGEINGKHIQHFFDTEKRFCQNY